MSIQSEITRLSGNVSDALTAIANKGVTVPAGSNSDDLATLIGQIQTGGGTSQTKTGTFNGNNANVIQIQCDFAPDLIYIRGDLTSSVSLRGICSVSIIKDTMICVTADSSTSGNQEYLMFIDHEITGYNTNTANPYATYANGLLSVDTVLNSGTARWSSSVTYSYKLVKWS